MRKHIFNFILISLNVFTFAQNGPPWKPAGNSASSGDFLGTTNNVDLPLKTNNTTRFTLKSNGDILFNSLISSSNSNFLNIDQNGKVSAIDQNSMGLFQRNGNDYYITNGNLGIGLAPSPSYKLDVLGDARISNNLFVGGGIVITSKVDASIEVKAGNILVSNDMDVSGNSRIGGVLTSPNGFMVDNSSGFKFTPGSTPGTGTFQLGKIQPFAVPCAAQPFSGFNFGIGGMLQIYDPSNAVNGGLMNLQTWTGGSSIDASTGGNTGPGGLLLNYFCGNNTFINTGANGGILYTGAKVDMAGSLKIGYSGNSTFDPNTSIELFNGGNPTWNGIKFITPWNGAKVISISNSNFAKSPFTVYASGKTEIGDKTQTGFHSDALLTVNGKMVAHSCYIRILNWADDVFSPEYKIPTPYETEKYYLENKHLEGVPSEKEVLENGVDIAEMNKILLRKVEEMTILMVKQQKEIDALKEKIK